MKTSLLVTALLLVLHQAYTQELQIPKPSPSQTITQEFGIGNIELHYSRPGLKNRRIGTDFVPYGQIWRTGANAATTITFSDDITFGKVPIKKGTYGLLSIPDEKEWTLILTSDLNVNMAGKYMPEHNLASVKVPVQQLQVGVETFTINFFNFSLNSCYLQLSWDHSLVQVPITTNVDTKISREITSIFSEDHKPYYAAAQYYYDTNRDLMQAKEWIENAASNKENSNKLHIFYLQALIYAKLGEKSKAKTTAKLLIEKATAMGNPDYVSKSSILIKNL